VDALKRVAAVVIASALLIGAFAVLTRERVVRSDHPQPAAARGWFDAACALPDDQLLRIQRGTMVGRSPDIQVVPKEPNYFGSFDTTTHAGPWDYVQEVPMVLYGPGFIQAKGNLTLDRPATVADFAPTIADLVGTPLPGDRPGRAITEALVPQADRAGQPKMILFIVWDGGGTNVLNRWPNAYPNLTRLMTEGTSLVGAEVGSSPSVTPAIHATMGTGAFPDQHGIVDIPIRKGDRVPESYPNKSPKNLELTTIADIYDLATDNEAHVGLMAERAWHLGMMGHGAFTEGADKDIAVMSEGGEGHLVTNPNFYSLPTYLDGLPGFEADREIVDESDGKDDGLWLGHRIPEEHKAGAANPVWTRYQARLLKAIWTNEGYGQDDITDMFFTNFKEVDLIGHVYNYTTREMRSTLKHTDAVLGQIIDYLDANVGAGEWVIAMTADHGSGPNWEETGSWAIDEKRLQIDIALEFGVRVTDLFQAQRPTGMWLNAETMELEGITEEAVSDFLMGYTIRNNWIEGKRLPAAFRDRWNEKVFSAAFPTDRLEEIEGCASS
jgi:Type I phosphodiesterase / nucleotide pyrophosphatase